MSKPLLDYVVVEPKEKADSCVIWLHGLGADGYDFADITPMLNLPSTHRIRFVFPHAPVRPVTLNNNMAMPAWFDIFGLDLKSKVDLEGMLEAEKQIDELIAEQNQRGISTERIILIGFSQGGALALFTGLRRHHTIAGIAGLSTYLPLQVELAKELTSPNADLPILMAHGTFDSVVPYWMGQESAQALVSLGFQPAWHSYPIAHTVCPPECVDLGKWIANVLYS